MLLTRTLSSLLVFVLLVETTAVFAQDRELPLDYSSRADSFVVQKQDSSPKAGSVYVAPTKKDDVLFKSSIWGAVQYPGIHYIPIGTRLVDAISIAGGPIERANMENITLSSQESSGLKVYNLSLTEALADANKNPVLKPNDVLVIKEDRSLAKATLYVQIGTFILSAIALSILISDHNKK